MKNSCMICLMKPFLDFSFFTCSYLSFRCRHSSHPSDTPFILDSRKKKHFGNILQSIALLSGCFEIYATLMTGDLKDIVSALMIMELVTLLFVLGRIILTNPFWRERNRELRVMLYVSEYLKQFHEEKYLGLYTFYHNSFYAGIICGVVSCGCQILQYSRKVTSWSTFVGYFNRFTLVYLVTSFYLRIWIDIAAYTIFFKTIFDQITRELNLRFNRREIAFISTTAMGIGLNRQDTAFLGKMKKLRRLYMTVLGSLRRTKVALHGLFEFITVSNHLQLTWLLFVTIMGISGTVELNTDYFLYCTRHLVQLFLMTCYARICDKIQFSVEEMATTLFRISSIKMSGQELREIELLAKLLGWEQPIKGVNDRMAFGISFLGNLTVDTFVNCMVITQLYFWINNINIET